MPQNLRLSAWSPVVPLPPPESIRSAVGDIRMSEMDGCLYVRSIAVSVFMSVALSGDHFLRLAVSQPDNVDALGEPALTIDLAALQVID